MRKIEAVRQLALRIESLTLNSMHFKMNRVNKDETKKQEATDLWNREMKALHECLVDVIEPNDEQAEAIKEELRDAKSYFAD